MFRSRVWRPALAEAGLLGSIEEIGPGKLRASWVDAAGIERSTDTGTRAEAVALVATNAAGGLRFHDLRHSYATWLISSGVPVNDVQRVMGHEQASTRLNRYTHHSGEHDGRVRDAFADFSLTIEPSADPEDGESPSEEGL
ncbi:tyrosine-type recombinase/integrase [Catellatospora sp. IY07-71]|uniref:tyrosine-type recombinase/integrase n=1 Tax=Catellatospora sp. IY07-71 TaxID=2728827 RepID=UPI00352FF83D